MSDLRQAAQQALEACEQRLPLNGQAAIIDELNNLRAALAQQAEPMGAVLVNRESREGVMFYSVDMIPDPATLKDRFELVKVYTAPPQRKPLTDEEILSVLRLAPPEPSLWPHLKDEAVVGDVQKAVLAIARAVERAHGIGEEK